MSGSAATAKSMGRDLLLGGLAASVVLALGLAATQLSWSLARERRASADERVLAELTVHVATEIEHSLTAVEEAARAATLPGAARPAGFVPLDPSASPSAGAPLPPALRADRDVAAALDRARDTGTTILGPIVDLGGGADPMVVAAAYTRSPTTGRPVSTVERRARIAGWVVVPAGLSALITSGLPDGAVASIQDAGTTWSSGTEPVPERLPTTALESHGHELLLRAGDPSSVGIPALALALAVTSIVIAGLAAAAVTLGLRRLRAQGAETQDRAAQIRLIGDVGPLVQQSLELADVLPAIAVQLSDHFELAGVSLSRFLNEGGMVNLFSVGDAPDPGAKAVLRPPDELLAGQTLALALERGGRSVAQLRLVAGRDLDAPQLQSLRAITELITAAVANASLYASQQEALRRLRDLDALKTGFLGTASHELRTPVTAIAGFSTLLLESWDRFDDDQRAHFVERIGANARSLGAVVQDLLDFSLLDRGSIVLTIEDVDLGALVGGVVDRLGPVFGDHEIVFSSVPAPAVAGDANGLERVISNLLTNAAKFSPANTTIGVSVGPSTKVGYGAEVVVMDQGPGIPREERHQVFTRFFRGSGEEVLRTRGVGIGLSVVAELVGLLHGEVDVDEAPGGGAQFTLRFPASSATTQAEEISHAPTA